MYIVFHNFSLVTCKLCRHFHMQLNTLSLYFTSNHKQQADELTPIEIEFCLFNSAPMAGFVREHIGKRIQNNIFFFKLIYRCFLKVEIRCPFGNEVISSPPRICSSTKMFGQM